MFKLSERDNTMSKGQVAWLYSRMHVMWWVVFSEWLNWLAKNNVSTNQANSKSKPMNC